MSSVRPAGKHRVSLLNRLSYFVKGPHPLHPAVWKGRLSAVTFRRFKHSDGPQCLEIYRLNETDRFPEGVIDEYQKTLNEQNSYFLVAERDGHIMATGGISYFLKPHLATLCFGLVRPSAQGTGLGTALLLARLALLKETEPVHRVLIFAVEKSFGFYERFGFVFYGTWGDVHGKEHPIGSLVISQEEVQKCRKLLGDHDISVPQDAQHVPFRRPMENLSAAS